MFDFITKKYRQRQLRKLMEQPRDKRIENWENIKTIGLVFTVGDSNQWNLIHRFITAQESRGKTVHLIGFLRSNVTVDYIFSHPGTIICHEKTDLTKLGLPKDGVVDAFMERHYDLVIDSTEHPDFFGKYISAMANADLKVGYKNTEQDCLDDDIAMYDLSIQGNGPMDFKDYIEQIVKYLTMVKKD